MLHPRPTVTSSVSAPIDRALRNHWSCSADHSPSTLLFRIRLSSSSFCISYLLFQKKTSVNLFMGYYLCGSRSSFDGSGMGWIRWLSCLCSPLYLFIRPPLASLSSILALSRLSASCRDPKSDIVFRGLSRKAVGYNDYDDTIESEFLDR